MLRPLVTTAIDTMLSNPGATMQIVLVNPPNCGRSIPEEEYGITSLKMIFRGEPLALETLAGNLLDHQVDIVDLKAEPEAEALLVAGGPAPDVVGFTAVTCEANTVLKLAARIKAAHPGRPPTIVVGGHHASLDPGFFHQPAIDYVVVGLGKLSFRLLVEALSIGETPDIPGVLRIEAGGAKAPQPRSFSEEDLVDHLPPRYDLVAHHRHRYIMSGVGGQVGFVTTAFGCTHRCSFCAIPSLTGGRYLGHGIEAIVRDIKLLGDIPLIRFVDANTFGDRRAARLLAERLITEGLGKKFVADVRADTVVDDPELMELWQQAGLTAVVIGFEEIDDMRLAAMNKRSGLDQNLAARHLLKKLNIRVIGDFIISPDYTHQDFDRLAQFLDFFPIDLPIPSILTPLPGTPLYRERQGELTITDLDYYTFSNAVLPTTLPEKEFYSRYAQLMKHLHRHLTQN